MLRFKSNDLAARDDDDDDGALAWSSQLYCRLWATQSADEALIPHVMAAVVYGADRKSASRPVKTTVASNSTNRLLLCAVVRPLPVIVVLLLTTGNESTDRPHVPAKRIHAAVVLVAKARWWCTIPVPEEIWLRRCLSKQIMRIFVSDGRSAEC